MADKRLANPYRCSKNLTNLVSNLFGCVVFVLTDDKPIILVVMHHTSDSNHITESWRLVTKQNVYLTVDCLFYEHHLLECNQNEIAWLEVQKYFGVEKVMIRFIDLIHVSHNQCGIH